MSQIRLYIDEDAQGEAVLLALRNAGVDAISTSQANKLSFSDEEQLIWATEQGRVIYSFNRRDFSRLHSTFITQERTHGGIILAQQQRYSVGSQLQGFLSLIATKSAAEMINQMVFLGAYIREE